MHVLTFRIGGPIGLGLLLLAPATSALAATPGPPLVTPALLSLNCLSPSSSPELRVVASAFAARQGSDASLPVNAALAVPGAARLGGTFVNRGVEALARYSYSHADESPTPWEEGVPRPASVDAWEREQRMIAGSFVTQVQSGTQDASGAVSFSAARDPRTGIAWSSPIAHNDATSSIEALGETSPSSLVRSLIRVADPVLEMADALRALRLNQVRLGDGLTLKLDGRTGRNARCFAILTQRF